MQAVNFLSRLRFMRIRLSVQLCYPLCVKGEEEKGFGALKQQQHKTRHGKSQLRAARQRWISPEEDDHQRGQKHQLHNKSRGSQIPREGKTAADSLQEKQSVKKAVNAET